MDENDIKIEQNTSTQPSQTIFSKVKNRKPLSILVLIVVLLVAFSAFGLIYSNIQPPTQDEQDDQQTSSEEARELIADPTSNNTILYGSKGDDTTLIQSINDSGKNYTPVTTLPHDIKSVIPLNNKSTFIYIANTNEHHEGTSIEATHISSDGTATNHVIYEADDDYKIDFLTTSKNNEWITWYETKPPENEENEHRNNYFRSFKANISSLQEDDFSQFTPSMITNQKSEENVTIRLPAIITDSGNVYFDGLQPVSYFLFDGLTNEAGNTIIPTNEYNSVPYLIDNRYLLYTAFNPSKKQKLISEDNTSAREEAVNKNEIRIFDIATNETIILDDGSNGEHYNNPVFLSGNIDNSFSIATEVYQNKNNRLVQKEIRVITKEADNTISTLTLTKDTRSGKRRILGINELSSGNKAVILGSETETLGGLGSGSFVGASGYKPMLDHIQVFEVRENGFEEAVTIKHPEQSHIPYMEYLGTVEKNSEELTGFNRNSETEEEYATSTEQEKQLQLRTFIPVEPQRERSNPRANCEEEWDNIGYPSYEACERCPVYIYSPEEQQVTVKPRTPIIESTANPPLVNGSWNVTANSTGQLIDQNNNKHQYIDYYFPRKETERPSYGVVSPKGELKNTIKEYALNLGLTNKEAEDVVDYALPMLQNTKYTVISHLKEKDALSILDVEVTPNPDTQHTIVFYFEPTNNPDIELDRPDYEEIERDGLSVIVWGAVINDSKSAAHRLQFDTR